MKFYEKRYSIKKEKNLKYYLLAASKNLSLNHVNQSSHVVTMDEEGTSNDRPVDDFSSYLSKFEGFLDKDEIDLVVYRFLYDFKFREIAKDKGVSTNVITSKYKRVMEKIKAHYPKGSI
jgi:DNA-directed RNA polymerase specialized sigma24 family protein